MKRQKNIQQVKQHDKTTNQTKEEKVGNLPVKEFRIMIVKMIKNLKNKMEKMQDSINKDLEKLKNKHMGTKTQLLKLKVL